MTVPIHELGGKGVFVKEVQAAVLDGRADIAVHSAKDLPSMPAAGLVHRGRARARRPARRAGRLHRSPTSRTGATVATGSVRRRAQLADVAARPHFAELRGNIDTRLSKVPPTGAVVVAAAALDRLGLAGRDRRGPRPVVMLPQVAQGALGGECRERRRRTLSAAGAIEHAPSRAAVDAERAFLAELGGGCDLPVGAHVTADPQRVALRGAHRRPGGHDRAAAHRAR